MYMYPVKIYDQRYFFVNCSVYSGGCCSHMCLELSQATPTSGSLALAFALVETGRIMRASFKEGIEEYMYVLQSDKTRRQSQPQCVQRINTGIGLPVNQQNTHATKRAARGLQDERRGRASPRSTQRTQQQDKRWMQHQDKCCNQAARSNLRHGWDQQDEIEVSTRL